MATSKNERNNKKKTEEKAPRKSWRTFFAEITGRKDMKDEEDLKREEMIRFSLGGVLFIVSMFLLLSIASHFFTGEADQLWSGEGHPSNWMGVLGLRTARFFIEECFGFASIFFPIFLLAASLRIMRIYSLRLWKWFINCSILMLWISAAGDYFLRGFFNMMHSHINIGGNIGHAEIELLDKYLGSIGTPALLVFTFLAYLIYLSDETITYIRTLMHPKQFIKDRLHHGDDDEQTDAEEPDTEEDNGSHATVIDFKVGDNTDGEKKPVDIPLQINYDTLEEAHFNVVKEKEEEKPQPGTDSEAEFTVQEGTEEEKAELDKYRALEPYDPKLDLSHYRYPTIDLLKKYSNEGVGIDMEEQVQNKNRIISVLQDFNIALKDIKATVGPTITLYEITPAAGVRISKIRNLEDDIALSLSALGIRIIAPIPGKGTIGIEVPNAKPQIVSMESVINSRKFQECEYELPMAIGKTITNEIYMADLAKMPHLLVAGATGQGKSVGLNAIITSLLYKKHPAELKLVMVDPKKVEFSVYSPIVHHFLAQVEGTEDEDEPIITDTQKVVRTLKSLCVEMDNRYLLLKSAGTRNIKEYNEKFKSRKLLPTEGHRFLPYIVVVIDEFGDLIMTAGKEIELPICRIAQLARAVGIHMIIATQRPTTNIITGTIKANFPARMAFKVSQMIDSRTILDRPGANQLVGKGDMLYLTGNDPVRVQCAFVDTPEVERIMQFISRQQGYQRPYPLPDVPMEGEEGDSADVDFNHLDSMFEEVARLVVSTQQGSTSMIQRKFAIGYNRAGRLMDQLEAAGIVGPAHGSKPREVLCMSEEDLQFRLDNLKG
ncbi:MAG: DNA translocase FtsK [Bacteroidaceae bacterium]|nr:DNA translocase FtsK [Bacteroidaceae bacterium]